MYVCKEIDFHGHHRLPFLIHCRMKASSNFFHNSSCDVMWKIWTVACHVGPVRVGGLSLRQGRVDPSSWLIVVVLFGLVVCRVHRLVQT